MVVISQQDQFINFVISLSNSVCSLKVVKLQKSNRFLKKTSKLTLRTTAHFHYSLSYQKLLKELYLAKHKFLNKREILNRFQSVFKKNCSTVPTLLLKSLFLMTNLNCSYVLRLQLQKFMVINQSRNVWCILQTWSMNTKNKLILHWQ